MTRRYIQTWQPITDTSPPMDVAVETKISDHEGERNIQRMRRGGSNGRLWFMDGGMYVYYQPTHWRHQL